MFIDSFSGSLSEIPSKRRGDPLYVLCVLKRNPVFSAFDIDSTQLAKTVDRLSVLGFLTYRQDTQYPWNHVDITHMGDEFLATASSPQPV
jgi:hypothetical protein